MKKGKSKCGGIAHSPTKGSGRLLKLGYGKKIKGYKEGKKIKGYRGYQEGGKVVKKEDKFYAKASKSMEKKIDKNAKRISKGKAPKTLVMKKSGRSILKRK